MRVRVPFSQVSLLTAVIIPFTYILVIVYYFVYFPLCNNTFCVLFNARLQFDSPNQGSAQSIFFN